MLPASCAAMLARVENELGSELEKAQTALLARFAADTRVRRIRWPEHDAFGSPERGEALVATNPNLRLVRLPGAGHLPWIDDADTVVVEIERFLATGQRSGVSVTA
jgi:pimeloyl-ACP methyl ester carboxylesterase